MEAPLHPTQQRRPSGCPAIHPQAFPVIPPAPFHLTDDLFSALHLRPLFVQHAGKPDEIVNESKATDQSNVQVEGKSSRDGSASAGPSTPVRTTFDEQAKPDIAKVKKREWIKPPRFYDSILGGLPDPRPLSNSAPHPHLLPFLSSKAPPPLIEDPPGFDRQSVLDPSFRFAPVFDKTAQGERDVVTLKMGAPRGVSDVYRNGQKNPKEQKTGQPPAADASLKNRKKRENEKNRKEYHKMNRSTAPGSLENFGSASNHDIPLGSPRGTGSPGRAPGTPRSGKPRTPGYASPGHRVGGPSSRVGTPAYTKSVNSPRPGY